MGRGDTASSTSFCRPAWHLAHMGDFRAWCYTELSTTIIGTPNEEIYFSSNQLLNKEYVCMCDRKREKEGISEKGKGDFLCEYLINFLPLIIVGQIWKQLWWKHHVWLKRKPLRVNDSTTLIFHRVVELITCTAVVFSIFSFFILCCLTWHIPPWPWTQSMIMLLFSSACLLL